MVKCCNWPWNRFWSFGISDCVLAGRWGWRKPCAQRKLHVEIAILWYIIYFCISIISIYIYISMFDVFTFSSTFQDFFMPMLAAKAVPTKLKIIPLEWAHQHQGIMVPLGIGWVLESWQPSGNWMKLTPEDYHGTWQDTPGRGKSSEPNHEFQVLC